MKGKKIMTEDIELKDEERQPCEIWTRVMGYHRPYSEYNVGKKAEFRERKCFCEAKAVVRMEELDAAEAQAEPLDVA